ncbi:MAG: alpha/beta fold hydrolase [Rhizobacter sp.]
MPTSQRLTMPGPAGALEIVIDTPDDAPRGVAVVCHPHPLQGGTLDNKVAATLARAFVQLGYRAVRLNFRGVGASEGQWDEGRGEVDDALAVIAAQRDPSLPLALAGFSFGGFVAAQAASELPADQKAIGLVLVGPSTQKQKVPPVPEGTVVIHGEADDVVPLSATLDWARPQALPVVVIPGAGHFFHGQLPLLKTLVVRGWPH